MKQNDINITTEMIKSKSKISQIRKTPDQVEFKVTG